MAPKHASDGANNPPRKRRECVQKLEYGPLHDARNEIRLLQILHIGDGDTDRLQFAMSVQRLDQAPVFNAVSYTWGTESDPRSITIGGNEQVVRLNCFHALYQICRIWEQGRLQSPFIWIDSICINQDDAQEKGLQVANMADLYNKANHVLAYVGLHSEDSRFLIQKVHEVANFAFDCNHADFLCSSCRQPWEEWVLELGAENLNKLNIACSNFGEREYWKRIWIIQEVARAKSISILCGSDMFSWEPLRNLEEFLALELDEFTSVFDKYGQYIECGINSMHDVFAAKTESFDVGGILSRYAASKCKDPRDRVYGLLSLINWADGSEAIEPSYTTSAYELAKKIEPSIALGQLRKVLASLKLNIEDQAVKDAIRPRFGSTTALNGSTACGLNRHYKSLCQEELDDKLMCSRIVLDEKDNFNAGLRKLPLDGSNPRRSSGESSPLSNEVNDDVESSIEDGIWRRLSSLLLRFSDCPPEKLILGSNVAGLTCNGTAVGDILVRLPIEAQEVFLVLRQRRGEIFDVVGQAILFPGYTLGCSAEPDDRSDAAQLFDAQVELCLSTEDAVLLFVQDMGVPEGVGIEEVPIDDEGPIDEEHWLRRLFTFVTTNPAEAARVTAQSSISAGEAASRSNGENIAQGTPPEGFWPTGPQQNNHGWYVGQTSIDSLHDDNRHQTFWWLAPKPDEDDQSS
ncbi:hypothetical protein M409DRAFT_56321 [Zasmidium cellare ATCC 36951]|uniref:Heterokaryon incompatibility domain-containing protein n=1 Tax=Zasmidium cellare ATCC 36951 TaxID=1080233 RepID=A0A6A6CD15_ZASCE|nr:uncharacterized protein M409DRAFT_56321 [Zasmidium cellare ATCC 36951]KAF2164975.1 hypothetical protein M409DRAFT_56321 [Zasmidium cellare ATCC 36951]